MNRERMCVLARFTPKGIFNFVCLFYPGLVQLWSAGLPLRSWWTIGAPSVQGDLPVPIFRFSTCMAAVGFEPPTSWLPNGRFTARPRCPPTLKSCLGVREVLILLPFKAEVMQRANLGWFSVGHLLRNKGKSQADLWTFNEVEHFHGYFFTNSSNKSLGTHFHQSFRLKIVNPFWPLHWFCAPLCQYSTGYRICIGYPTRPKTRQTTRNLHGQQKF